MNKIDKKKEDANQKDFLQILLKLTEKEDSAWSITLDQLKAILMRMDLDSRPSRANQPSRNTTPPPAPSPRKCSHVRQQSTGSKHSVSQARKSRANQRDDDRASKARERPAPMGQNPELGTEVDELKAQMRDLKRAKGDYLQWLNDEESLLALLIVQEEIPPSIKIPKERYNETADPKDHLAYFRDSLNIDEVSDAVKCKIFPITLSGITHTWFYMQEPRSFVNFSQINMAFLSHFSSRKKPEKTLASLMTIRQETNELLKSFVDCFNAAVLEIEDLTPSFAIEAFIAGLQNEHIRYALTENKPTKLYELIEKAHRYAEAEEATVINDKVYKKVRDDANRYDSRDDQNKANRLQPDDQALRPRDQDARGRRRESRGLQ